MCGHDYFFYCTQQTSLAKLEFVLVSTVLDLKVFVWNTLKHDRLSKSDSSTASQDFNKTVGAEFMKPVYNFCFLFTVGWCL